MMQVVEEINKKSADFARMKVPVIISVDRDTKEFEIHKTLPLRLPVFHILDKNYYLTSHQYLLNI